MRRSRRSHIEYSTVCENDPVCMEEEEEEKLNYSIT